MRRAALFELEDVSLSRGGRTVLAGVDLAVQDGVTALLGASGAGKSSLLRLLCRLAEPDDGVVRFQGTDVRQLDPLELRRRACLVPQLPAPLEGTVAENVSYGPRLLGREADVAGLLELAGLDASFADRRPERLSVGEQQRMMLARALALEPEVLLLDEPTAALDESSRGGVERTLGRLAEDGRASMLLVTHERGQADRLADRVVTLADARLSP